MRFTTEQRIFVISTCYEMKNNVLKQFLSKGFPQEIALLSFISFTQRNVQKHLQHDTSLNLNKEYSGKKKSFKTRESVIIIRNHVQENPARKRKV